MPRSEDIKIFGVFKKSTYFKICDAIIGIAT